MRDVFIGHVHGEPDGPLAIRIAKDLSDRGYSTWCYEQDAILAVDYLLQTGDAVEDSRAFLLLISVASIKSNQVHSEVVRAHESGKPFVPLLLDMSHAEFQSRQPAWRQAVGSATTIDVRTMSEAALVARVVQGLSALGIEPSTSRHPVSMASVVSPASDDGHAAPAALDTQSKIERAHARLDGDRHLARLFNELAQRQDFTVLIGADCSMACGVPDYPRMRAMILSALEGNLLGAPRTKEADLDLLQFDRAWESTTIQTRYMLLSNWLKRRTAFLGVYHWLAQLTKAGYLRRFITYASDTYFEQALHSVGVDDFLVLVNGTDSPEYIRQTTDDPIQTWILKTHGDHTRKIYALSEHEVVAFGEACGDILRTQTRGRLLILGYAGTDQDFLDSLAISEDGDEIWFVHPAPPPAGLRALMDRRASTRNHVALGFETLLETLYYGLYPVADALLARGRVRAEGHSAEATVVIRNRLGFHAAIAAKLIKLAASFASTAWVRCDDVEVNAKSLMGLLMLGLDQGSELTLRTEGPDAHAALREMVALLERECSADA